MKKFKAFSLTEAMIIIVILAIAIAATTPIISRKIVNITEAGSTIGGGTHGRYEIFSKEIIDFGGEDGAYEKTTDPSGGGDSSVIVFRRLDDPEYKTITGSNPELNGAKKSTLYEQINDAEIFRDPNGVINYVKFQDPNDGIEKKFPVGGKIIIESSDVIYVKGCLDKTSTPKNFSQKGSGTCIGSKVTLPNKDNRIIEGNLVDKYPKKHPISKNDLWHLPIDAPDGEVTDIPWERLISGDTPIIDRPISPDPDTGEYIGTFTPTDDIQNITLHGVGGGGAGGGVANSDIGKAVSPKTGTSQDLAVMKKELAKRFNEVTGANIPADTLVKEVNIKDLYKKKYENISQFTNNERTYILLNKYDGTITVKVDVRIGKYRVFPHQLLDYTKVLGTQTQDSVIYDMPVWGTFADIYNRGFYAGVVGQGCAGGAGMTYHVNHSSIDFNCKRQHFCPGLISSGCVAKIRCPHSETTCAAFNKKGECTSSSTRYWYTEECSERKCTYRCDGTQYTLNPLEYSISGGCGGIRGCERKRGDFNAVTCINTYPGGAGGAAPPSAVACKRISTPIQLKSDCYGPCPGESGGEKTFTGNNFTATPLYTGTAGRSCALVAGDIIASSNGGGGGKPHAQAAIGGTEEYPAEYLGDAADWRYALINNPYGEAIFGKDYLASYKHYTQKNIITPAFLCDSLCGTGARGANGAAGQANSNCESTLGINTSSNGLYNYIYTWTTPYSINRLVYGEAGNVGEYKTVNISKLNKSESFKITLGIGGKWENVKTADLNKNGPDGTDTVVNVANGATSKEVLRAKGGKGGQHSRLTNRYDLCYANKGTCAKRNSNDVIIKDEKGNDVAVSCCDDEYSSRSTIDINATIGKASLFENIKALVGKSRIIGIGLGRSGEGAGSRAGSETVGGQRAFINASGSGINYENSASATNASIFLKDGSNPNNLSSLRGTPAVINNAKSTDYANIKAIPSELNFKGGDGAVIILW